MANGEINALDMRGAVPFAVRVVDDSGDVLGDYDFLGWAAVGNRVEPIVLEAGKAQRIDYVQEARQHGYKLLFPDYEEDFVLREGVLRY